jgi:hypothetical protein
MGEETRDSHLNEKSWSLTSPQTRAEEVAENLGRRILPYCGNCHGVDSPKDGQLPTQVTVTWGKRSSQTFLMTVTHRSELTLTPRIPEVSSSLPPVESGPVRAEVAPLLRGHLPSPRMHDWKSSQLNLWSH